MNSESTPVAVKKILTTSPPSFSVSEVIDIAARHYGIQASVRALVSERDQNFQLNMENGDRFIIKLSNSAEQFEVIDFQNHALLHAVRKDATLPLPRVIRALDGNLHCTVEHGGKSHYVRVLSWLEGEVLHSATSDAGLAGRMGRLLARLGLALKDFDHPGSNPPLLWDMKRASSLRELLVHIEEPKLRQLIDRTLERFDTYVKPVLDTLRTQVIHNDMNPGNVLVNKLNPARISGLIDFGDMVKSPLIQDVAVAAAYQLGVGDDPLGDALPLIAGYHDVVPLQDQEIELLPDLIKTRLLTSLLIGSYRVNLFPENRAYLMVSFASARAFLLNLEKLDTADVLHRIRAVCTTAGNRSA